MAYVNYGEHITAKYGVIIENWALKKFVAPGSINSIPMLTVLKQALETGVTRFRALSDDDWKKWIEAAYSTNCHQIGTAAMMSRELGGEYSLSFTRGSRRWIQR